MSTEELEQHCIKALISLGVEVGPKEFKNVLGAVLCNLVGNMPEAYWKEMQITSDEDLLMQAFMEVLGVFREEHANVVHQRKTLSE